MSGVEKKYFLNKSKQYKTKKKISEINKIKIRTVFLILHII